MKISNYEKAQPEYIPDEMKNMLDDVDFISNFRHIQK